MISEFHTSIYSKSPIIIQDMILSVYGINKMMLKHHPLFKKSLNMVLSSERYSLSELKKLQLKCLRNIIHYAYNDVPYYHSLFRKQSLSPDDIKTENDLKKIPILTREDIKNNSQNLISKNIKNHPHVVAHTSGTTGTPMEVMIDIQNNYLIKAIEHRSSLWAGYKSGDRIIRLVGDNIIPAGYENKRLWRRSYSDKRIFLSSYNLDENFIPKYIDVIERFSPAFIRAYPSTAFQLAKYMETEDIIMEGIKGVLLSSEPIFDYQKEIMEKQFNSKIWGYYASAEAVVTATQCSYGNYHLSMIDGILEIEKDGESVEHGEKGETVVTTLCNYSMPLIRYAQGDLTGYDEEGCNCNRKLQTIYPVETKMEDIVITYDGKIISPSILTFPFKDAVNIIESQVVQEMIDQVVINIVPHDNYKEEDGCKLVEKLKPILGSNMNIDIHVVSSIDKTAAGKTRFVISKIS